MSTHVNLGPSQGPSAHVAVNRNRLKHYGDQVFLKKGTCFEIELFNPKRTKVLAKIQLNGKQISSSGIVLRPGERVFLERWIDTPQKFIFDTYEVEDSPEARSAIVDNGLLRVEFYDESAWTPNFTTIGDPWVVQYTPAVLWYSGACTGGTTSAGVAGLSGTGGPVGMSSSNVTSYSTDASGSTDFCFAYNASVETGRAEAGPGSQQSFSSDRSVYQSWMSSSVVIHLLPESQRPTESIRNYCSNCGTRKKSTGWKFCPTCGTGI
jgi:hypothetical protein